MRLATGSDPEAGLPCLQVLSTRKRKGATVENIEVQVCLSPWGPACECQASAVHLRTVCQINDGAILQLERVCGFFLSRFCMK